MDADLARWLISCEAAPYLDKAAGYLDPSSLQAGAALRKELDADRAAAILDQVYLRRRAVTKLGEVSSSLFLTHDGLEQATRWDVARWRARTIAGLGISRVIDAGCGVGIDALALQREGSEVTGIECDPVTAVFAQANLWTVDSACSIREAFIEDVDLTDWLGDPQAAVFLDPARRTGYGRSWDLGALRPSWEFVSSLLATTGKVVVKLAPGMPRHLIPHQADVTWVSHRGDLVETTLWSWNGATGVRQGVVLDEDGVESRLVAGPPPPSSGPISAYLYEPDPSVIRAHAIGTLATMTQSHPLADSVAYLSSDRLIPTPFATAFKVEEVMAFSEKTLRSWVRAHEIGIMEIKVRGLDIDPAILRRRLGLRGKNSTLVILTPTAQGATALIAHRVV